MKTTTNFDTFHALEIRVGQVVGVDDAATRKPTYRLTIDFGAGIGTKVSCGAYRNYSREGLLGRQVICVMNLGVKKMGPEISEVLVLGVPHDDAGTVFLTPESSVKLGVEVF